MKVNGLNIEEYGSGYSVTVRFFVGSEELPLGDNIQETVEQLIGSYVSPEEEVDNHRAEAMAAEKAEAEEEEEAPKSRRGGGRTGQRGKYSATSKAAEASSPEEDETTATSASPSSRRGRRGKSSKPSTSETSEEPKKAGGGRRGKRGAGAKASANTEAEPEYVVEMSDVMKAATLGAQKLGPIKAVEIFEQFGVEDVPELDPDQYEAVIDAFDQAIAELGDE